MIWNMSAEHLPTRQTWGTANLGRVTKGTALGMLAKVYLYRQDYAKAYAYAKQVIESMSIVLILISVICLPLKVNIP